jgi:hypothetical protein
MIRFNLDELGSMNAHHRFEDICRHFARERIAPNILHATGPVSAGVTRAAIDAGVPATVRNVATRSDVLRPRGASRRFPRVRGSISSTSGTINAAAAVLLVAQSSSEVRCADFGRPCMFHG